MFEENSALAVAPVEIEPIVGMNPQLGHLEGIESRSTPIVEAETNILRSSDIVIDNIPVRNSRVALEENKLYWAERLFADMPLPLVTAELALTDCSLPDAGPQDMGKAVDRWKAVVGPREILLPEVLDKAHNTDSASRFELRELERRVGMELAEVVVVAVVAVEGCKADKRVGRVQVDRAARVRAIQGAPLAAVGVPSSLWPLMAGFSKIRPA